jgi:DNA-binding transcriptional LysR family regulator
MHIENFKIFSDLVESQSFSRAAKMNKITQSAVSQQLRAMEKHFGVLIIDRSQKQFRLTPEGEQLYQSSREILHRYQQLASELLEMRQIISGNIHIATVYSIGLYELPPYLKQFMQSYPTVNVRVEYRRSNLVYEDVLQNSVDLGLVALPQKVRQLEVIPFKEDVLVLVANPKHPLCSESKVQIEELAGHALIAFDPDIPTRKALDQYFREHRLSFEPVMEFDNIETVKRAVEIGAGIAFIPLTTVQHELAEGTLKKIPLEWEPIKRPLAIVHRKGRIMTPALKKLISTLVESDFSAPDAEV